MGYYPVEPEKEKDINFLPTSKDYIPLKNIEFPILSIKQIQNGFINISKKYKNKFFEDNIFIISQEIYLFLEYSKIFEWDEKKIIERVSKLFNMTKKLFIKYLSIYDKKVIYLIDEGIIDINNAYESEIKKKLNIYIHKEKFMGSIQSF